MAEQIVRSEVDYETLSDDVMVLTLRTGGQAIFWPLTAIDLDLDRLTSLSTKLVNRIQRRP